MIEKSLRWRTTLVAEERHEIAAMKYVTEIRSKTITIVTEGIDKPKVGAQVLIVGTLNVIQLDLEAPIQGSPWVIIHDNFGNLPKIGAIEIFSGAENYPGSPNWATLHVTPQGEGFLDIIVYAVTTKPINEMQLPTRTVNAINYQDGNRHHECF